MRKRRVGFTLIELMIVISIMSILLLILLPNYVKARSRSRLNACESNIRGMATACEQYATDNNHFYATTLSKMVPNYLRSLGKCPSTVDSTSYINGYSASSNPDTYTVSCQGGNHLDLSVPADYPKYSSDGGLVEH